MFLKSFKVSWPAACQLMPTDSEYIDGRVLYSSQSVDQLDRDSLLSQHFNDKNSGPFPPSYTLTFPTHIPWTPSLSSYCVKEIGVYQGNSYSGMHLICLNCRTIGFSDGTVNNRKYFLTYDDLVQFIPFCLCLNYKIMVHALDSIGINWSL